MIDFGIIELFIIGQQSVNLFMHLLLWSTILFVAVGCGVIPIVPRLQVSSSLDISTARTATSLMSILTSKHRLAFPTSLSRHILAVIVPVKGLWEHFHTPLSAVRGLCFPLCWAWNPLSSHCCLTIHDVRKWVSFETHLRGYLIF